MKLIASQGHLHFSTLPAPFSSKDIPPRCCWKLISFAFIHVNVVKSVIHRATFARLAVRRARISELLDLVRKHNSLAHVRTFTQIGL